MPRRPFFAYVHYLDIHRPYCPPPRTRQTFVEPASRIDTCHEWRKLHLDLDLGRLRLDAADQQAMRDRYDEEILDLDLRLGELFDTLRALGLWDETLVVLTADHGEEFFEHGNQGHGDRLWDELLWVPLVVKPPGSWRAPRGARVDGLVEVRDLVPTALAAAGVRLEPGPGAVDLLPWVAGRGAAPGPRRFVVGETAAAIAVRTAEHKLVAARDGGKVELFDLVRDPGEQ
jgi:arylsulfatase A-like enzyme